MSRGNLERRQFVRTPESATVEISFADPESTVVTAELVETSQTGFRIAHSCNELSPGLEILLSREDRPAERGRVIWTHVLDGRRLSGCLRL